MCTFLCVSHTNAVEVLIHLQHLIPCPSLQHLIPCPSIPTINLVDERSLLITSCWEEVSVDNVAAADGDENGGVIGAEGAGESSHDEWSTGEGPVSVDKRTRGRGRTTETLHLKTFVYTSSSFVAICDGQQNVVQSKCCIIDCTGKACGMTMEIIQSSPTLRLRMVGIICRNVTRPSSWRAPELCH